MKFALERATDGKHKWIGVFTHENGSVRRIPFGASGYEDYTQHHNPMRRKMYLTRHQSRESWNDPQTAGSLSRWILWGDSTSLQQNVKSFRRRFSLS